MAPSSLERIKVPVPSKIPTPTLLRIKSKIALLKLATPNKINYKNK